MPPPLIQIPSTLQFLAQPPPLRPARPLAPCTPAVFLDNLDSNLGSTTYEFGALSKGLHFPGALFPLVVISDVC